MLKLNLEPFHVAMLDWKGINNGGRYYSGVLAPRGAGKSELCTIGDAIYQIVQDPNLAGQIVAESEGTAVTFLSSIKQHFEGNDLLRAVYGDHTSDHDWSIKKITSGQRNIIRKEPTIQTLGVGGRIVGRHVNIQWCDDLVSLINSDTELTRAKLHRWYNTALNPILDPGGIQKIRGTRYFTRDLYYNLMEAYGKNMFLIIPALTFDPSYVDEYAFPVGDIETRSGDKYNSSGQACVWPQSDEHSYWADRFPLLALLELRKKEPISFSTQYLNSIDLLMSNVIQPGGMVMVEWKDIPDFSKLIFYIGVDPASRVQKADCLFSISTIAVDKSTGLIYIIRQRDKKLADPDEMLKFISQEFHWVVQRGGTVHGVGVEVNSFQNTLVYSVRAHPELYGVIPFCELYTLKDKETRFINVAKYFNLEMVRFYDDCYRLFEDVGAFPDCEYKDRVDSMMIAFELLEKTGLKFLGIDLDIFAYATAGESLVFNLS